MDEQRQRVLFRAGAVLGIVVGVWLLVSHRAEDTGVAPYVAGAGIGVLSWLAFWLAGSHLGASGFYVSIARLVERALTTTGPNPDTRGEYARAARPDSWSFGLVCGIPLGACVVAVATGEFNLSVVPPLFERVYGFDPTLRAIFAVAGGVALAFGARMAGGCTSGHGISGVLQLMVSSLVAAACFFAGGIATAFIVYGGGV